MTTARAISLHSGRSSQVDSWLDAKHNTLWYYMSPKPRACFSQALLADLREFQLSTADMLKQEPHKVQYIVACSNVPGVFNLGGDLELFARCIRERDVESLREYAVSCIDVLYRNHRNLDRDVTSISLVQGDALGGGFEAAISSQVVIAERGSRMGFPEVLFNLFPGMGAYNLLARKLDGARAERMILSGQIYQAEELFDMGLVDVLADPGEGERAVYEYIRKEDRARNGFRGLRRSIDALNRITWEQLLQVVDIWVETAMSLTQRDLKMMQRLVARQYRKEERAA